MAHATKLLAAVAALAFVTFPSVAQQSAALAPAAQCGERTALIEALSRTFKETPVATGIVNANAVIEVFASDGGTWTIVATGTDGTSCVLSAGEGWDARFLAALPGA